MVNVKANFVPPPSHGFGYTSSTSTQLQPRIRVKIFISYLDRMNNYQLTTAIIYKYIKYIFTYNSVGARVCQWDISYQARIVLICLGNADLDANLRCTGKSIHFRGA